MSIPDPVLVVQTAFLGDVILTLPVAQVLRRLQPGLSVDMMVVPRTAAVIANHPDIRETLIYDKRGADSGLRGFFRVMKAVKRRDYRCAIVPHRSLRSALLAKLAGIPVRVGFDSSAGRRLFSRTVPYARELHEIDRNLRLLEAVGVDHAAHDAPRLYPGEREKETVTEFLAASGTAGAAPLIAIAPGTVWNTKRWPAERFAALAGGLARRGFRVILVGGPEDAELCREIAAAGGGIMDASGKFPVLGSAELIRRSALLVCNDSAPLHLATAVGTPVLAIFGATIPAFGFGPTGPRDRVMETRGLPCRPCSIHGGDRCPVGTFECMIRITPETVLDAVISMTSGTSGTSGTGGRGSI